MYQATQFLIANPDGTATMRIYSETHGEVCTRTEKVPRGKLLDWGRKQRVKGIRQPKTTFGWVDSPNKGIASRKVELD